MVTYTTAPVKLTAAQIEAALGLAPGSLILQEKDGELTILKNDGTILPTNAAQEAILNAQLVGWRKK